MTGAESEGLLSDDDGFWLAGSFEACCACTGLLLSRPRLTLGRDSVFRKCRSEPKLEAHELISKRSVPSSPG